MRRALPAVLSALAALSCGGADKAVDPLARCAADLEACYAPCPRPTWVLMASAPGHLWATGTAAPGGRQHSRAIDDARALLARSAERLGQALLGPLADALAPTVAGAATIGLDQVVQAIARRLEAEARLTSRVTQVYEDCVTGDVYVLVVMDPSAQVEAALGVLADLGRQGGLFLMGREAEALAAVRKVLEARLVPDLPPPEVQP